MIDCYDCEHCKQREYCKRKFQNTQCAYNIFDLYSKTESDMIIEKCKEIFKLANEIDKIDKEGIFYEDIHGLMSNELFSYLIDEGLREEWEEKENVE